MNGRADIFVHDVAAGTTRLITGIGNMDSLDPVISADGRYVAFQSGASNLAAGDTNGTGSDVFLHDLATGTTILVSAGGNLNSYSPSISADGRYVSYYSFASNLVASDSNGTTADIFVYDRVTGTTEIISNGGNGGSLNPSISLDGRFVTFESSATNLDAGDTNGSARDLFVHDRQDGVTRLLTGGANGASGNSSIAGDGSVAIFQNPGSNVYPGTDTNNRSDVFAALNSLFNGPTDQPDTLIGDAASNIFTFVATTLTAGDLYDGQGGADEALFAGGGLFDFSDTAFASVEVFRTDGSNSVFDFAGYGATEGERRDLARLISDAAGTADLVKMGNWHQDFATLGSLFDAGIETVEWSRATGFTFQAARNASGQTVITNNDSGGLRVYASIVQTWDAGAGAGNEILRESVTTFDDGRISDTVYDSAGNITSQTITDPLNAVNYQSLENVYSGGLLQSSSLTSDNGNTSVKSYTSGVLTQTVETDVADDFTWDVKTTTYNTSGVKTGYVVDYDAGEARSQMSFAYTGGILTNRTITNSGGSASEASYNTSGEMQFVRNTASDGTMFMLGGTGDNTLTGGALDDLFKGGAGSDIFEFSGTVGNDTILDFTDGQDRLDLSAYGYTTLADLQNANAISEVNGNTVIDLGADGSVTLNGLALTDFGDADLFGLPVV